MPEIPVNIVPRIFMTENNLLSTSRFYRVLRALGRAVEYPLCLRRYRRAEEKFRICADDTAWLLVEAFAADESLWQRAVMQIDISMLRLEELLDTMCCNVTPRTEVDCWIDTHRLDRLEAAAEAFVCDRYRKSLDTDKKSAT